MAVFSAPLAESRRTSRECTTETCEQVLSVSLAERPPDELVDGRDVARSAHASIPLALQETRIQLRAQPSCGRVHCAIGFT